jgi:Zn-dependent protease with chaperone function
MERAFQGVAVIFAAIAAYFLWTGNNDGAFVSAVLGCVAFFLSIRFQVKERNRQRELEQDQNEPDPEPHSER